MSLLALEPQILARLTERLPAGTVVDSAPALDELLDLQERPLGLSAVYVMYLGAQPLGESPAPRAALRLLERWAVIVAYRDRAGIVSGAPARAGAGTLADAVLDALHGWQPTERTRPVQFSALLQPVYSAGLQLLPLAFTHETARHCGT